MNLNTSKAIKTPSTHLISINVLRGIAALWVLAYHTHSMQIAELKNSMFGLYVILYPILIGFVGVHLFLVISGFCIHLKLAKSPKKQILTLPFLSFWKRRFWRLYPAYFAAIIFSVSLFILAAMWSHNDWTLSSIQASWKKITPSFLAHLLMLQIFASSFIGAFWNPALWSLALEEHLYLIYSAVLWVRNKFNMIGLLCVSFAVSLAWRSIVIMLFNTRPIMPAGEPHLSYILLMQAPSRWFEWCLGVCAAEAYTGRITLPKWCYRRSLSFLLMTLAIGASYHPLGWIVREPLWGGCLFILLNNVVKREKEIVATRSSWEPNIIFRSLAFLGLISYSVYLLHMPMLKLANLVSYNFGWSAWGFFASRTVAVFTSIALAYIFYQIFEKPFIAKKKSSFVATTLEYQPEKSKAA